MALYFDDFTVGQEFMTPARTVTEGDVMLFAGMSGDFNPLHTDYRFAAGTEFGKPVAHGPLVLALAVGLNARLGLTDGTTIALLAVEEWRFRSPVFFGDTIRARVTIADKRTTSKGDRGVLVRAFRVFNQNDQLVQEGRLVSLVKRRERSLP